MLVRLSRPEHRGPGGPRLGRGRSLFPVGDGQWRRAGAPQRARLALVTADQSVRTLHVSLRIGGK
jgi:hypothetical protein